MKKILFLFIVCICFSSCFTTKKYHVAENNAKQTLEQNGITVISEYLNEGEIAKRHGRGDDNLLNTAGSLSGWNLHDGPGQ